MPFPKVMDYHKPGKPLVPSSYGILYALISVCYWYVLSFIGIKEAEALALATSVLFGSTMGLFDDMTNLRWRYKAILPIFTALPYMVLKPSDRTAISLLLVGVVDFGSLFFLLLVPLMVTIVTNTYNQLGGLNGLETLPGLIILIGLSVISGEYVLTVIPIICLIYLGYLSVMGSAFIGNVGSFSIGLTLAVYAILANIKLFLIISLAPHLFNSILILFSNYILHDRADTLMDEKGSLYAMRVRSLRTLIIKYKKMPEHRVVVFITMMSAVCVVIAYLITMMM